MRVSHVVGAAVMSMSVALAGCGGGSSSSSGGQTSSSNTTTASQSGQTSQSGTSTSGYATLSAQLTASTVSVSVTQQNLAASITACNGQPYVVVGQYGIRVSFSSTTSVPQSEVPIYAKLADLALTNDINDLKLGNRGTDLKLNAEPWTVCFDASSSDEGHSDGQNMVDVRPTGGPNQDTLVDVYRNVRHEMVHGILKTLTGLNSSYDTAFPKFIDEGFAQVVAHQSFLGSSTQWDNWFANGNPDPWLIYNYGDQGLSFGTSAYFAIYPYYAAVVRYMVAPDGLGLGETTILQLIENAAKDGSWATAWNNMNLGNDWATTTANLQANVSSWLAKRTSTFNPLWNGSAIQGMQLISDTTWNLPEGNIVSVGGGKWSLDASGYPDGQYKLEFLINSTQIYGDTPITVKSGKLTSNSYDLTGDSQVGTYTP